MVTETETETAAEARGEDLDPNRAAADAAADARVPRRVIWLIVIGLLIPVFGGAYLLVSTLGAPKQATFVVVDDYLRAPETVAERVAVITQTPRRIQIAHGGIEVYDAEGTRHSISPDGTHTPSGGAEPVPAEGFALSEVDFTTLPAILAAAAEHSGARPSQAILEMVGRELRWRVSLRIEGQTIELMYSLAGQPLQ